MVNRKRIAANFLSLATTNVIGLVATILISVYVRRIFGPTVIGQVDWARALVTYLLFLVNPGLTIIGQRDLAKQDHPQLINLILTFQVCASLVVYGSLILVIIFGAFDETTRWLLLIIGLTMFTTSLNLSWLLQAKERMVIPSLATLACNVLQLPLFMAFLHTPDDVYLYAGLGLTAPIIGTIFNYWYLRYHGLLVHFRPTLTGTRALLHEAWPLTLTNGVIVIYVNSATLLLGITHGNDAVGQYTTAYRLMMVAGVITAAFWNAYFPAFAQSQNAPEQAINLSREYLRLVAWMGFPITALGWSLGHYVIHLLYGAAFDQAGHLFEWLCLTVGLQFLSYGVSGNFIPWGHTRLQLKTVTSSTFVNLVVCTLAIPIFSAMGAVYAVIVAEITLLAVGYYLRRKHNIFYHPMWPIIWPALLCSIFTALAIVSLPNLNWWFRLAGGLTVLGGCLLYFERATFIKLLNR